MEPALVDTHILIWLRARPATLRSTERKAIEGAARRFVSAASLWEIALLQNVGRIPNDVRLLAVPVGFELLAISPAHCEIYAALPRLHKDPFDRMLVAQARAEGLSLITRDQEVLRYMHASRRR